VKEAFFTFQWEGSELLKEFSTSQPPGEKFFPITYKKDWDVVRDIDKAMGVSYDCKG
jgi:phosphonate transport system substrate-binding protein